MLGDFNEISHSREQFGGQPSNRYKMDLFNSFLNKGNLLDFGFVGPRFTWTNGRHPEVIIRTRIYRDHANSNWLNLFSLNKGLSSSPDLF